MKLLFPALLCVPLLSFAQETPAPAEPAPVEKPKLTPQQVDSIIKQLDQLESQITKSRGDAFSSALSRFRTGMTSPKEALDLHLACIKLENFDRKNLKASDFQEWKDRNEGRLKDPDFAQALQLQLEYLVMSIQAQDVTDVGPLVPGLQAYLVKAINAVQNTTKHTASGAVVAANGGGGGRRNPGNNPIANILRQSVKGSDFSKTYKLDEWLRRQDWSYEPLAVGGMYDKIIFPHYLEKDQAQLPALWDARINAELVLQKAGRSEAEFAEYYKESYPQLQWSKANYLLRNNINPILALADMLKIVRENPTHTKAGEWLTELRSQVNAANPASPAPATGAEPAPAAP